MGGNQCFLLGLAACHKWGPTGDIFINYLDNSVESSLTKFADDTILGTQVDTSERRALLQKNLDRLKEWASKNCTSTKTSTKSCTGDDITKEPSTG